MIVDQLTTSTLNAVVVTFQAIAFVTTAYRLSFRCWTNRIWWDDFWAFVGLIFDVVSTVGLFLVDRPGSHKTHVIGFWLIIIGVTVQLWVARISLAVAIIRINPHPSPIRRWTVILALFVAGVMTFLLGQKIFVCAHPSKWSAVRGGKPKCNMGRPVAISNLSTSIVVDLLLILVPLRMLWHVKLADDLRRLILVLFSASVLTMLGSIPEAAMQIWVGGSLSALTTEIESAISLTVCNLLIVVTHIYRMFYNGEDTDSAYDFSRMPTTTRHGSGADSRLTSVHFDTTENSTLSTEKSSVHPPESTITQTERHQDV